MKISVMSAGFRRGFEENIRCARAIGADGVQMDAVETGLDFRWEPPVCMARAVRDFVYDVGLDISAYCVDIGGFACASDLLKDRLRATRNMMRLAQLTDVPYVTAHIGEVPADRADPIRAQLVAALQEIGRYGEDLGVDYCIETGGEKACVLADFLEEVNMPRVGVNYDPANLVMCVDDDPVAGVHTLGRYIRHTHAKDGICLSRPEHKYWPEVPNRRYPWVEVPLGCGEVDFPGWISALREEGFDGYLAIEREVGENPEKDIRTALEYLRQLV